MGSYQCCSMQVIPRGVHPKPACTTVMDARLSSRWSRSLQPSAQPHVLPTLSAMYQPTRELIGLAQLG